MPKPKGKVIKKTLAAQGPELSDAGDIDLKAEIGKSDAIVVADKEEEEAPIKATNGRGGGGRGKKTEAPAKKPAAVAPKSRGGRGKKLVEEIEVITKDEYENDAQSNGDANVEDVQQEEVVTKVKATAVKGKRGAKAAAASDIVEVKENGDADTEKEISVKVTKGKGGKKAVKEKANDKEEDIILENNDTELKAPLKKAAASKKKNEQKIATEAANGKEIDADDESTNENNGTSEHDTEAVKPEEIKEAVKKTGGRKKKADDSGNDGKTLFDLLKEEHDATKDKVEKEEVDPVVEANITNDKQPEKKPAAKKASAGRKKKADEKTNIENVADNEANGRTDDVDPLKEDADVEIPKKKGRGGRKPAAVTEKVEIPVEKRVASKRGAKAKAAAKVEEIVEVEKKPIKRGRGAVGKTVEAEPEEVTDVVATEEAAPKKRSRKEESSVIEEIKTEIEKPKKGVARGGKRKAAAAAEEEPIVESEENGKIETMPDQATEDAKKPAMVGRGRKRAAPSTTNKTKSEANKEEPNDKNEATAEAPTIIDEDEDEADGSKSSKAKKKKKETQVAASDTTSIYNKEDFLLPPLAEGQSADEPRFNLKISSWNVAGLRAWFKKGGLKFLDYEEPDIFCLQETKCVTDQLPDELARIPGYHPYWLCKPGGYAGVAIYSKIMPIHVEYGIGHKEFDDVGRIITAEYEKFFLINVYVPNSGRKLVNLEPRMKWEKLFQEFVQKYDQRKPVIICGDMNVSHKEIDLANPKTNTNNAGFTIQEREKMTELLSLGYVDTFRHLYADRKGAYTFWTYMGNARARNVGWRLDYFIVSERFIKKVVDNCMRSQCMGSDHCPITLFLNL